MIETIIKNFAEKMLQDNNVDVDKAFKTKIIIQCWIELYRDRVINEKNIDITNEENTKIIIAFFSKLPFVEVTSNTINSFEIKLKEFRTDELPSTSFDSVLVFLDEISNGIYDPKRLQSSDNDYRRKSSNRQDLRILGFLNDDNEKNENLFKDYSSSNNRSLLLRELILQKEFFQIVIFCLQQLGELPKQDKKRTLIELGKLIVRNSQGDNLMVDSVATSRTGNILDWLQHVKLIGENYNVTNLYLFEKGQMMDIKLKESFIRIANEYINARTEPFGGHPLASFIRREVPLEFIKLAFLQGDLYKIAASGGKGNWANVPWISILNTGVTTTTENGYYLVYLFSEDMDRLYLSFSQGITGTPKEQIPIIKQAIRDLDSLDTIANLDDEIYLGESQKAKGYASATAAYIPYDLNNLPSNEKLVEDLRLMIGYYEQFIDLRKNQTTYPVTDGNDTTHQIKENKNMTYTELVTHIHSYIKSKGFYYRKEEVINLFLSLKSKPFVILSGISGTGKTKMVQWFAESVGANEENGQLTLIPVRPDWNDGSDLLGYVDIKGEFKEGPLAKVIERAISNPDSPYFVLLDEMNLARVEHYFSDILSVMESRKWKDGKMVTSTLISKEVTGREHDVILPSNLYVIGTVNMDETTHPFSKKVLDRANTIEFNRVKLSNLSFLEELEEVEVQPVSNEMLRSTYLHLKDVYVEKKELVEITTAVIEEINKALRLTNAHVGYRVRDEICFYLAYNETGRLMKFETALDHCILQKILPRITGSDTRVEKVLLELYRLFTNKKLSDDQEANDEDLKTALYPQSAAKVLEMIGRLRDDGFTSFWIS